jgi:peptidase E
MEKLFLASYFTGSVKLFTEFSQNSCSGKKVVFIPTASVPEKATFFVDSDEGYQYRRAKALHLPRVPRQALGY